MPNLVNMLIIADAAAALLSLLAGEYLRLGGLHDLSDLVGSYYLGALVYTLVVLLSGYFCELYTVDRRMPRIELVSRIAIAMMVAFFILSALLYTAPQITPGRGALSFSLLICGGLQYLIHRACHSLQTLPRLAQRILILGVGPLAETIQQALPLSSYHYELAGFVRPDKDKTTVAANQIIGSVEDIEEILAREKINKLIVSITEKRGILPVRNLLNCKLRGVEILDSPSFYEKLTGKLLVENIQPSWFLYADGFRITPLKRFWKRGLDLLFSSFGIVVALPVFPIVALLIKCTSPGPILYRQKRVGEGNCEFTLMKFRTMCNDAEKETGPVWACENDSRVTRVGSFLRKSRLDEIPQLFNVMKGEMSFIGPRPERREFVDQLSEIIPYYGKRHFIKPGVTGWAQVRYPYGASESDALEKLRYDLYYIKNYSITLDLIILLETVKVVLFGRGGR